jgi:hypothetical protein
MMARSLASVIAAKVASPAQIGERRLCSAVKTLHRKIGVCASRRKAERERKRIRAGLAFAARSVILETNSLWENPCGRQRIATSAAGEGMVRKQEVGICADRLQYLSEVLDAMCKFKGDRFPEIEAELSTLLGALSVSYDSVCLRKVMRFCDKSADAVAVKMREYPKHFVTVVREKLNSCRWTIK